MQAANVRTRDQNGARNHRAVMKEPGVEQVYRDMLDLQDGLITFERSMHALLDHLDPGHERSARNLLHYLGLRRRDNRGLQRRLSELGLSSLGRSESCVLASVHRILTSLARLADQAPPDHDAEPPVQFEEGLSRLEANTAALFGPAPADRHVRIMVTMSTEAAHHYDHVRDLVAGGMNCMRINCSHDDAGVWSRMIENVRRASAELQKPCRILMDLAGPKLRTGPVATGPSVLKLRPTRDALGRVLRPARVLLTSSSVPPEDADAFDFVMRISSDWLERMRPGDRIVVRDARGATRKIRIKQVHAEHAVGECKKTVYLVPGIKLRWCRRGRKDWRLLDVARLTHVPATEQVIQVKVGERVTLAASLEPGHAAARDDGGRVVDAARIGCTLPEVFNDLQVNEPIWFDDGKIGGRIVSVSAEGAEVEITHALPLGSKLGADKGINLPQSQLRLPSLTAKDLEDLAFVVKHADMVGYSFVRTPRDVVELQEHLHDLGGEHLGVVLKIETQQAFDQLPDLLLAAMRSPRAGVMIARGDLAVECGYERLAEVQEEILWFCEAAHLPVIWATEVLAHLAKEGLPSRAEITDAAMGERAECVMLNKGPHIVNAVCTLDDILKRMADHQRKKRSMLRPLKLAGRFGL